jgi:hypothetical protein
MTEDATRTVDGTHALAIRLIFVTFVVHLSGCIVPAEINDFSAMPNDSLTAPVKKYVRSWDVRPRTDVLSDDAQARFFGRSFDVLEKLIGSHGGRCEKQTPAQARCVATFHWKVNQARPTTGTEPKSKLCLHYAVVLEGVQIQNITVEAVCFE